MGTEVHGPPGTDEKSPEAGTLGADGVFGRATADEAAAQLKRAARFFVSYQVSGSPLKSIR